MRVKPLGPLRADAIFDILSKNLDKNCVTLEKKGCDMDHSSVINKIVTPNAASNDLDISENITSVLCTMIDY